MRETVELADWRRRVSDLYSQVRAMSDPHKAWSLWVEVRQKLFVDHPQSPIPQQQRRGYRLPMFGYDPAFRVLADLEPSKPERLELGTSGEGVMGCTKFATARFTLQARAQRLSIYWLDGYAGGLFLPFRDSTSGKQTYGAGRYLLDSAKGADLGMQEGKLVLDFNFAYPPSCSYDERWSCPLSPPDNHLPMAVRAGEQTFEIVS